MLLDVITGALSSRRPTPDTRLHENVWQGVPLEPESRWYIHFLTSVPAPSLRWHQYVACRTPVGVSNSVCKLSSRISVRVFVPACPRVSVHVYVFQSQCRRTAVSVVRACQCVPRRVQVSMRMSVFIPTCLKSERLRATVSMYEHVSVYPGVTPARACCTCATESKCCSRPTQSSITFSVPTKIHRLADKIW